MWCCFGDAWLWLGSWQWHFFDSASIKDHCQECEACDQSWIIWGTLVLPIALSAKGKTMTQDSQSTPDIAFFQIIGMTLLALTFAVGAITIVGSMKVSEPSMLAQSLVGHTTPSDGGILSVDHL